MNYFEQFYGDYTHIMLFVNSNKLKLGELQQEAVDIKMACNEILENVDFQYALRSLKGLKSRLSLMQEEINANLFQYRGIDNMLHQIDVLIADYNEMDIQIDLYELNGIENDLLDAKRVNDQLIELKLEIDGLYKNIEDKIGELEG